MLGRETHGDGQVLLRSISCHKAVSVWGSWITGALQGQACRLSFPHPGLHKPAFSFPHAQHSSLSGCPSHHSEVQSPLPCSTSSLPASHLGDPVSFRWLPSNSRLPHQHKPARHWVLTSPASQGRPPMALCRARISSEGPVMRDVPVSRMAAQPWAQRVSPVPTITLRGGKGSHQRQGPRAPEPQAGLRLGRPCCSPLHVDLPVGRDGDGHEGERRDVVSRV